MSASASQISDRVPDRLKRKGRIWELEITDVRPVTATMHRVIATGPALSEFTVRPGQSLILVLPQEGDGVDARHYTVRSFDPKTRQIAIDVALHGTRKTPANRWVLSAEAGDRFAAVGPRGHVVLKEDATHHLICVDETGLPAAQAILEGLPAHASALALIEIGMPDSRQPIVESDRIEVRWLCRADGTAPGAALISALHDMPPQPDATHVYLAGETSAVRDQRRLLVSYGYAKTEISAEGYWRPGRNGGHDHIDD
ncbi:siderophore-interacting protein [Fulvimarina endophytica]|uniref:Siderophore-interacting protein n=1 Tax=Fulvimarina endophytica TaxID=2293836 RepID=A0A371WXQ2_9HYPH|nr:siderophore-interacting protein [Fulvimarina endophytica]RFC61765.1 siderophore-interacting protein [Fulvimarina endophytica]